MRSLPTRLVLFTGNLCKCAELRQDCAGARRGSPCVVARFGAQVLSKSSLVHVLNPAHHRVA